MSSTAGRRRPSMRTPAKLVEDISLSRVSAARPSSSSATFARVQRNMSRSSSPACARSSSKTSWSSSSSGAPATSSSRGPAQRSGLQLEITLESADEQIRRDNGKFTSSNEDVIRTAQSALGHGCRKLDLFFMVGLPRQTRESALANIDFCEDIHRACGMDKRLSIRRPAGALPRPCQQGLRRALELRLQAPGHHSGRSYTPPRGPQLGVHPELRDRPTQPRADRRGHLRQHARLNDFKLKYGLINAEAHRRIAQETAASLAWMGRVREAVAYRHARPAAGAQRVQPQRHPHPERAALEGQPPLSQPALALLDGHTILCRGVCAHVEEQPRQVGGAGPPSGAPSGSSGSRGRGRVRFGRHTVVLLARGLDSAQRLRQSQGRRQTGEAIWK